MKNLMFVFAPPNFKTFPLSTVNDKILIHKQIYDETKLARKWFLGLRKKTKKNDFLCGNNKFVNVKFLSFICEFLASCVQIMKKFMYDKNFSLKRFKRIAKQNLNYVIILTENEKVKALNKYREKHF